MNLFGSHITRLLDFTGRENRKPFWLWFLIVYGIQYAVQTVLMLPTMLWMMPRLQAVVPPPGTTVEPDPAAVFAVMIPMFRIMGGVMVVMVLLYLALLSAALVRRLHDRDMAGWWALPAGLFQLAAPVSMIVALPALFGAFATLPKGAEPPAQLFTWFVAFGIYGFVGAVVMIALLVLLVLPGTTGPNRFGTDPLEGQRMPAGGWPPAPPRTTATIVPSAMREPPPLA